MSQTTRQQIVDAVEKLIQEKGLARVRTKEIAHSTGLSEGALYRHFDHKEEVYLAVFEKQVRALAYLLDETMSAPGPVEARLAAIALAILRYYEQITPLAAAFFADTELLASFRQLLDRIGPPERLHAHIAAHIEDEQRLGHLTSSLPALTITTALLGPVFQYAFLRQLTGADPFGAGDEQFVDELVRLLAPSILPAARQP